MYRYSQNSRRRKVARGEHRRIWWLSLGSLVSYVTGSWIDPDSPKWAHTTKPLTPGDAREYRLVFSDEFEKDGRTFRDGYDPRWTAIEKNDYTNDALHYYSAQNAYTHHGVLNITTEQKTNPYKAYNKVTRKYFLDHKYIQSAMLQGWNKFCFIGGIIEFSAKLPGDPKIGGLWPALWMLGNLARATYVGSSNFIWPYSYSKCDPMTRRTQEVSACTRLNHYGLNPFRGRGSPEIDILETMQGDKGELPHTIIQRPYQSLSLQIAPGLLDGRPHMGQRPKQEHWYEPIYYGNNSNTTVDLNPFFYGVTMEHDPEWKTYQADALSANLQLNETHYQKMHHYRLEWDPPSEDGQGGYLRWYTDGYFIFGVDNNTLTLMGTEIPSEPSYLLINTAVSSNWGFPKPCPEDCSCECYQCGIRECSCGLPTDYCKNFPAGFEIDYVRLWQAEDEPKHVLGCSPAHRPTAKFIQGHRKRYMEEGDKVPLLPIQTGGNPCESDRDCGGLPLGKCLSGICKCSMNYTGPTCLAHRGFYDYDSRAPTPEFIVSTMVMPLSLKVLLSVVFFGFIIAAMISLRLKSEENKKKYQKLSSVETKDSLIYSNAGHLVMPSPSTYHNQMVVHYAMPPHQKVKTYCVIDSRLVDQ